MDQEESIRSDFSNSLQSLKEEFHRRGRYDDSGIKLDEITKLLFLKAYEEKRHKEGKNDRFNIDNISDFSEKEFGSKDEYSKSLIRLFEKSINSEKFERNVGTSIFGRRDSLNIRKEEDQLAKKIIEELSKFDILGEESNGHPDSIRYDLLNDAFGHFVRDTFRNTKEDAQYMTPPEAVQAMTSLAFSDILEDERLKSKILKGDRDGFKVLDPSCGVGSFLASSLRKINEIIDGADYSERKKEKLKKNARENYVIGQDKVDRMVRLSKLNMLLFGGDPKNISQGNSIKGKTSIDRYAGCVDLILTNPPFKAKFERDSILVDEKDEKYSLLNSVYKSYSSRRQIPSEIALLDRCYTLLREGGRLLIVLPESIASSKGLEARIRSSIDRRAILKSVIALPPVAFAQAGTRTRTCILYLQKGKNRQANDSARAMIGECEDIGYDVVQRKGTPVRQETGESDLVAIANTYSDGDHRSSSKEATVVSEDPPVTWVPPSGFLNGRWTPSFYSPRRLNSIQYIREKSESDDIIYGRLKELTTFQSKQRNSASARDGVNCISVSHVDENGLIDFSKVDDYNPKTEGLVCKPGDVIISRLNPHILRCSVVPDRPYALICSNEFEILRPVSVGSYILTYSMLTDLVKDQIVSLTTGTSSSHSRIKREELKDVLVPIPKEESRRVNLNDSIKKYVKEFYESYDKIKRSKQKVSSKLDKRSTQESEDGASENSAGRQRDIFG